MSTAVVTPNEVPDVRTELRAVVRSVVAEPSRRGADEVTDVLARLDLYGLLVGTEHGGGIEPPPVGTDIGCGLDPRPRGGDGHQHRLEPDHVLGPVGAHTPAPLSITLQ